MNQPNQSNQHNQRNQYAQHNHNSLTEEEAEIRKQLEQTRDRERFLHQQQQILLHEQAQLNRKKRNHRIFTRGGMLEAFLKRPLLLSDDQVYRLLQTAFNTREVKTMESRLLSEAEHDFCRDKSANGTIDGSD